MIHVHCGDSSAATLRQSGIPGDVIVWTELLVDGPTPGGVAADEWRRLRARFLSDSTRGVLSFDDCRRRLATQDEALARCLDADEVALWFDACLFDQSILIRQLDWFDRQEMRGRVSLICVSGYPGFVRFTGLGELDPVQMAALLPSRHAVTPSERQFGRRAWEAFCASEPAALEQVAADQAAPLPFVCLALRRQLEQYPSVRTGLSRLQRETLQAVVAGKHDLSSIFVAASRAEERPYFGDTTLWRCLDQMASARASLVRIDGPGPLPLWDPPRDLSAWAVYPTATGERVLRGDDHHVRLNGIDEWRGGVHLRPGNLWLWDELEARLVKG